MGNGGGTVYTPRRVPSSSQRVNFLQPPYPGEFLSPRICTATTPITPELNPPAPFTPLPPLRFSQPQPTGTPPCSPAQAGKLLPASSYPSDQPSCTSPLKCLVKVFYQPKDTYSREEFYHCLRGISRHHCALAESHIFPFTASLFQTFLTSMY